MANIIKKKEENLNVHIKKNRFKKNKTISQTNNPKPLPAFLKKGQGATKTSMKNKNLSRKSSVKNDMSISKEVSLSKGIKEMKKNWEKQKHEFKNSIEIMSIENIKNGSKKDITTTPKSVPIKNKVVKKTTSKFNPSKDNKKSVKYKSALPKIRKKITEKPSISLFVASGGITERDIIVASKTVIDKKIPKEKQLNKTTNNGQQKNKIENDDSSFEWLLDDNDISSLNISSNFENSVKRTLPKFPNKNNSKYTDPKKTFTINKPNLSNFRHTNNFDDTLISEDLLIENRLIKNEDIK